MGNALVVGIVRRNFVLLKIPLRTVPRMEELKGKLSSDRALVMERVMHNIGAPHSVTPQKSGAPHKHK